MGIHIVCCRSDLPFWLAEACQFLLNIRADLDKVSQQQLGVHSGVQYELSFAYCTRKQHVLTISAVWSVQQTMVAMVRSASQEAKWYANWYIATLLIASFILF